MTIETHHRTYMRGRTAFAPNATGATLSAASSGSRAATALPKSSRHGKPLTLVSHHLCPYVQRAAIALAEKSVEFDRMYVDLAAKPLWFTQLSPMGKVPLLIVDDMDGGEHVIFESAVICEYIEETQDGPRLHPENPVKRAQHRGWMEFGSTILADIWGLETTTDGSTFVTKRAAVAGKFCRIEETLAEGPFFRGEAFSLVDAVYAPIFRYFDVFDTIQNIGVFDGLMKVQAWRAALADRPSVQGAVTDDYHARLVAFLSHHEAYLLKGPHAGPLTPLPYSWK